MVQYKVFVPVEGNSYEIRRLIIENMYRHNYLYLKRKIASSFIALKDRDFTIYWKDEEGDDVRINTNDELQIAINENTLQPYQKIYVNVIDYQDEEYESSDSSIVSYEETNVDDEELEQSSITSFAPCGDNGTEQRGYLFRKPKKLSIVIEEEESEDCKQEQTAKSDSDEKSDTSNSSDEEIKSDDELEVAINEALLPYDDIDASGTEHRESQISEEVIHSTVTCNACDQHPLYGFRYKCLVCYDYDLCANCEKSQKIHTQHPMLRIPVQITLENPLGKSYENLKNNMIQNLKCLLLD